MTKQKPTRLASLSKKNCYANPNKPELCFFLALACHISLSIERLEKMEQFFLSPGKKIGSASSRFYTQLAHLIEEYREIARQYLCVSHCNAHGIRKGSGSYASSATTAPPLFVATAARGEWSIGKVLDVYFKFGAAGDQYLRRLLAFLDPSSSDFAVLPPHWKAVRRGLRVCFGGVLEAHRDESYNPSGFLLLLLASIVHHSDS